ncbi:MAG TPA: flagellar protein FliT [Methylotenera sp.]|nr:flagellar protein FliT [Methylotenera sp.]
MSEALINKALVATEQQVDRANHQQWEDLIAEEPERQQLIKQLTNLDHNENPQELAKALNKLFELNQTLEALCLSQRAELVELLKDIGQGNKAKKAYQGK